MDEHWMSRALALARRGEGCTRPNPPVGAVVVRRGRIVGAGYHKQAGGSHAEVFALRQAAAKAEGATLYVTLEPCSTTGRTPPCTAAILAAGITRVVVACRDPNPAHAGRGLRLLRRKGVSVTTGVCAADGRALIAPFAKWVTTGRPYVTLKLALTLDGRIADRSGHSKWITGPAARRGVQSLRRRADAVLVGRRTVEIDDPSLTCRAPTRQALFRIVVDSTGGLCADAQIFCDAAAGRTVVATTAACTDQRQGALERNGSCVWRLPAHRGRVSLKALLRRLGREGMMQVLCEGGAQLAESLIREGLVDEYIFFIAPKVLGSGGLSAVGGAGWRLGGEPRLRFTDCKQVGDDIRLTAVNLK